MEVRQVRQLPYAHHPVTSMLQLLTDLHGALSETQIKRTLTRQENQRAEYRKRLLETAPKIVAMLDEGMSKKDVAAALGIHLTTVYDYLKNWELAKK